MEYVIREAASGEEKKILPLYEWLFADPGARPGDWDPEWAEGALGKAIEEPESSVFVAEEPAAGGVGIAGVCSAYIDLDSVRYGTRCWVEDLVVDPDRRSAGVGGLLLDSAEDWARGRGATHFELDTGIARVDAQRFYESRDPVAKSLCYQWRLDPRDS